MNKKQIIIGVSSLIVLLAIGYFIFVVLSAWLKSLDPTVAAATTTAALGLVGLWYAQWTSKSRDIAENHRPSKIDVYSIFFNLVEKFQAEELQDNDLGEENLPEWLKKDFAKLNRGLILWASPQVITAWLEFRTVTSAGGDVISAMDKMYRAIRKDLGNSNFGLKSKDLIRIGLKDPTELK